MNGVVNHASRLSLDRLMASHIQDVERLYNRCNISLDFKSPDAIISTEDLMRKFGQDDSYLEAVVCLFNLGRYLTIASSREGTSPSNLQGIWNDKIRAPWCSNYTLNINTEMNYFATDLVGLSECYEPLISFTKLLAKFGALRA